MELRALTQKVAGLLAHDNKITLVDDQVAPWAQAAQRWAVSRMWETMSQQVLTTTTSSATAGQAGFVAGQRPIEIWERKNGTTLPWTLMTHVESLPPNAAVGAMRRIWTWTGGEVRMPLGTQTQDFLYHTLSASTEVTMPADTMDLLPSFFDNAVLFYTAFLGAVATDQNTKAQIYRDEASTALHTALNTILHLTQQLPVRPIAAFSSGFRGPWF